MNKTKLGNILGTAGLVAGIIYGMKSNKGFVQTALFTTGFAIAGVLIGNSLTKYYE